MAHHESSLGQRDHRLHNASVENANLKSALESSQRDVERLTLEMERLTKRLNEMSERAKEDSNRLTNAKIAVERRAEDIATRLTEKEKEVERLRGELTGNSETVLENKRLRTLVDQLQTKLSRTVDEVHQADDDLRKREDLLSSMAADNERMEAALSAKDEALAKCQQKLAAREGELLSLTRSIEVERRQWAGKHYDSLVRELDLSKASLGDAQSKLEKAMQNQREAETKYASAEAARQELVETVKSLQDAAMRQAKEDGAVGALERVVESQSKAINEATMRLAEAKQKISELEGKTAEWTEEKKKEEKEREEKKKEEEKQVKEDKSDRLAQEKAEHAMLQSKIDALNASLASLPERTLLLARQRRAAATARVLQRMSAGRQVCLDGKSTVLYPCPNDLETSPSSILDRGASSSPSSSSSSSSSCFCGSTPCTSCDKPENGSHPDASLDSLRSATIAVEEDAARLREAVEAEVSLGLVEDDESPTWLQLQLRRTFQDEFTAFKRAVAHSLDRAVASTGKVERALEHLPSAVHSVTFNEKMTALVAGEVSKVHASVKGSLDALSTTFTQELKDPLGKLFKDSYTLTSATLLLNHFFIRIEFPIPLICVYLYEHSCSFILLSVLLSPIPQHFPTFS